MSILTYTYQFSGSTTEPPTGSQLRFDADIATGTQKIWVRYLTADGVDAFFALMAVTTGCALWVQDKDDHTKFAKFTMTGPPVDKGGYVELPVTWFADGAPLTSQQIVLGLVTVGTADGETAVTVPNVVGLTEAAATSLLASANLAVGARTTAPGPVPPGAVAYQAPAAGLFVAPQTPIAITVASGPPPAPTVPPTSATPGDPLANSYETVEEFKTYCASRAHTTLPPDDQIAALLIQGTNLLDNTLAGPPDLELAQVMGQLVAYAWTQQPATDEQALAWPRVNEKNRNGSPIPPTVIPQGVKDCVSEIVLGLQSKDLTATNDTAVQGISSVKASSVAVSFKDTPASSLPPDQRVRLTVLPDAAWLCLVPSWYQWPVQAGLEAQGKGSAGFDFAVT